MDVDTTTLSMAVCHPQTGNGSCEPTISSNIAPFNEVALRATYIVIGSLGLIGNFLVIFVIFNYTTMKKKLTNSYIINQSMIDMVASIFIMCQGIFEVEGTDMEAGNVRDEMMCSLWLTRAPLWSMLMSSTCNLVALTLERYFEIVHPIAHKIKFTRNKAVAGMVFVWIFGPAYNLAYEVPTSKIIDGVCYPFSIYPSKLIQSLVGVLTILLQYILPIIIMAYCYIRIAMVVRTRIYPAANQSGTTVKYERARRNIIKTLVIVCICFTLCWTWNEIFIFLYFVGYPTDFSSPFYHFTVVAVFTNSCINPFIYTAKYEEFQRGLRQVFKRCRSKKPIAGDTSTNSSYVTDLSYGAP